VRECPSFTLYRKGEQPFALTIQYKTYLSELSSFMKELQQILQTFQHCQQHQQRCAIATIIKTQGSVYRRTGARMLMTESGQMVGAISGGCLESDIFERAQSLIFEGGAPQMVRYDTSASDDLVWGLGLGCNGVIDVLIESLEPQDAQQSLAFITDCFATQIPGAIATIVRAEGSTTLSPGQRWFMTSLEKTPVQPAELNHRLTEDLQEVLRTYKHQFKTYSIADGQIEVFLECILPPVSLVIFGAGQDAIPVVEGAKQLGWHVTICDNRPGYVTHDRFPNADQVLFCEPDKVSQYPQLLQASNQIVIMTHQYHCDLLLLQHLLPSPVSYIGLLGPKQRSARLLQELNMTGFTPTNEQLSRLYSPIGLDIGAETPEEIALSIIAEIQAVRTQHTGNFLRDRSGGIHDATPGEFPCLVSG
jgi:xanthine dehydrogenase accessory factor